MDLGNRAGNPISKDLVKVSRLLHFIAPSFGEACVHPRHDMSSCWTRGDAKWRVETRREPYGRLDLRAGKLDHVTRSQWHARNVAVPAAFTAIEVLFQRVWCKMHHSRYIAQF